MGSTQEPSQPGTQGTTPEQRRALRAAEAIAFLLTQLATLAIGAWLLARGEMSVGTVFLLLVPYVLKRALDELVSGEVSLAAR